MDAVGGPRIGHNRTFNQGVAGSIPARPTNRINNLQGQLALFASAKNRFNTLTDTLTRGFLAPTGRLFPRSKVVEELRAWPYARHQQTVARASAGDVDQVSLAGVNLLQIGVISDAFDPGL